MRLFGEDPILGKDEIYVFGLVNSNTPGGPTLAVGMVVSRSKAAAHDRVIQSVEGAPGMTAHIYSLGEMLSQLAHPDFVSDHMSAMAWAIKQQNPDPWEGE